MFLRPYSSLNFHPPEGVANCPKCATGFDFTQAGLGDHLLNRLSRGSEVTSSCPSEGCGGPKPKVHFARPLTSGLRHLVQQTWPPETTTGEA
jgi:hypothetical protein